MPKKFKLIDTGKKDRLITFRLKESVYSALEKEAQATGGTVSATIRRLIVESLGSGKIEYMPGDILKSEGFSPSSAMYVVLGGGELPTSDNEVARRIDKFILNSMDTKPGEKAHEK